MKAPLPYCVLLTASCLVLASCGAQPAFAIANASPERGKQTIESYGCGSCHVIPGVTGARGMAGPPLISWSRRGIIAGHLPNTPDNLVAWIVDPPKYSPGTAMPKLGVSEAEARDIAAYLYTLR
ncbi:MAG TPA: c-type cytochrome [Chloroflexota bacterium]|nr:c-type cytochrome [Chloroflexota bacterium]